MPYLEIRLLGNTMRKEDNRLFNIENWDLAREAYKQVSDVLLAVQRKDKEAKTLLEET